MGKRYSFFRDPKGKPYKGADGRYAPQHVLSEIGTTSSLDPNGNPSWPGLKLQKLELALQSALAIIAPNDGELNDMDAQKIIWQAVVNSVKRRHGQPLTFSDFLDETDRLAAEFFRLPPERYALVTSLSIAGLPAKSIWIRDARVSPLKKRGKRFPIPEHLKWQLSAGSPVSQHLNYSKYQLVKILTEGRSMYDAVERAMDSMDLLRGLWSLFATYGSWAMRFGGVTEKPLGVIHMGPIHTLHFPDGRPADQNVYWYNPHFTEDLPLFREVKKWKAIEKHRRWATRQLAKLAYREELEDLLIRYAKALDQLNTDVAFLQMWSILEKITDTVGSQYDETIKRAVWFFSDDDRPIAKEMLESLRQQRNRYVHHGTGNKESDQVAYMIKFFVDPHLSRLLSNALQVRNLEEYGRCLTLPTNPTELAQREILLRRALRIRKPGRR